MAQKTDIFGYGYEDDVPAFVSVNDKFSYHRKTHRLLTTESINALAESKEYEFGENEIGVDDDWLMKHLGYGPSNITPTVPEPNPSTTATAGTPGSFNGDVPADLTTLQGLGALGNTTAWSEGEYVVLGDESEAYWDGSAWAAGKTPAADPEPNPSTTATEGAPGSFDGDAPADLTTLQGLGALGNTTAWAVDNYVVLGDASEAYWDGSAWAAGKATAAS